MCVCVGASEDKKVVYKDSRVTLGIVYIRFCDGPSTSGAIAGHRVQSVEFYSSYAKPYDEWP